MYYSYHAMAKKLIRQGDLIGYEIKESYHNISPVLVLYFSSHSPMPIREYRWQEYFELIEESKKVF